MSLSSCVFTFQNVQKHFKTIPVDEKQDVTLFIYYIKTGKSKLDQQRRDEAE